MNELDKRLAELARTPVLLVASDYDGTIAPIVEDPGHAVPRREAAAALRAIAALPHTHVAIISGRSLRDLATFLRVGTDNIHLVGSHGSEFDLGFAESLTVEQARLRQRIIDDLGEIAASAPGLGVEVKPAGATLHTRKASRPAARRAIRDAERGPAALPGVFARHGKEVLELGVVETNKGTALSIIRARVGASAVIFFGDDRTDEDAFATLCGPDVAVKVGNGTSAAALRVDDTEDVARALARLAELRTAWFAGGAVVPIEHHTVLSDLRAVALLTPDARVTWLCLPRVDSSALMADLLGGPGDGHFTVSAHDGAAPVEQHYVDGTLVVETCWPSFTVTDFLDCSHGRPAHRAGRSEFVRILEGTGRALIEFAPRLDFGRRPTQLATRDGGLVVEDAHEPIVLRSPGVTWEIRADGRHDTAVATVDLANGPVTLELVHGSARLSARLAEAAGRRDATIEWWREWTDGLRVPHVARHLVTRAALTLKALCHGPTGAICAAATTSLPETLGGVRNWDYRFCWLRDGALAARGLALLGSTGEAMRFLDWLLGVVDQHESPAHLRPVYTVSGGVLGSEAEVSELPGYASSRPVRVGNAAGQQVQLDVFGPILDLMALLAEADAPLSHSHWRLVESLVQAAQERWREPDHGIWEIRKPRRHHVHSKAMCWVTVDRALMLARQLRDREMPEWRALRDEIAEDVLANGWDADRRSFRAAYDGTDIDAAALQVLLTGLVTPDDPRFGQTIDAVERELRDGPVVMRYRADDGLPGLEGGFHLCTCWLIQCYILAGRLDEARALFDEFVAIAGPTGMYAEEYDPAARRSLGNVPQAFSHYGLIEAAVAMAQAEV